MLHAEPNEGRQGAIVLGDGTFHLDLPERDQEALLELGVEAEQPRGLPEVAAGGGERVHGGGDDLVSPPLPAPTKPQERSGRGQPKRKRDTEDAYASKIRASFWRPKRQAGGKKADFFGRSGEAGGGGGVGRELRLAFFFRWIGKEDEAGGINSGKKSPG